MPLSDKILILAGFVANHIDAGRDKLSDVLRDCFAGRGDALTREVSDNIGDSGLMRFVGLFFQEFLNAEDSAFLDNYKITFLLSFIALYIYIGASALSIYRRQPPLRHKNMTVTCINLRRISYPPEYDLWNLLSFYRKLIGCSGFYIFKLRLVNFHRNAFFVKFKHPAHFRPVING